MIETAFAELAPLSSTAAACRLLGKPRATHYRRQQPKPEPEPAARPEPPNKLSPAERQQVLDVLHEQRHADRSVAQVWATLLDDGIYLASQSTMHRILREAGEARERRAQATHPLRARPELVARAPNASAAGTSPSCVAPVRGQWFDLYVMLDIFSRYVPHWIVAAAESAELGRRLGTSKLAGQPDQEQPL